ncbi:MAG TPA: hypothetical protein VJZ26_01865 [Blastocatellia bacterium]|nr:hypothetical protein [Blastocatellia bacterium]
MSEAALKITEFERQVMKRRRLLALQDRLALAIPVSCIAAAVIVLFAKMTEGGSFSWTILAIILAAELAALAFSWFKNRATQHEAAFLIDDTLRLEDRLSTAHEIIGKGGPQREVEAALIDDAAARISDQRPRAIVPYQLRKWYALSFVGIAALVVALLIPARALPGGEAVVEARADIQSAGEQLEQAGEEIARVAPAESETAKLAEEQAELGRVFRRSPESRSEALKKLSALEERIRKRHGELASTRADEIVNIAEQRLRSAIRPATKQQGKATEVKEDQETGEPAAEENESSWSAAQQNPRGKSKKQTAAKPSEKQVAGGEVKSSDSNKNGASDSVATAKRREVDAKTPSQQAGQSDSSSDKKQAEEKGEQSPNAQATAQGQAEQSNPQNRLQKPVSATDAKEKSATGQPNAGQEPPADNRANQAAEGQEANKQNDQTGEQKADDNKNSSNPVTSFMAEQAAKALPSMSAELLKKAAELRAGQLKPEDLKGLQRAAETMARDLSKIAQSKELQQMAEQLAKQITPEQIEQFARALGNVEQLKQELEAAAKLMMQNQEAKSMVAGLAQKFAKIGEEFGGRGRNEIRNRQQENNRAGEQAGGERAGRGKGSADDRRRREFERASGGLTQRTDAGVARTGVGRETKLTGNVQRGTGGEYLFLKSQAGGGAARAPYSSAYPQYRREAERSVERSQVPPHMRSLVRSYFDAINPDATKKP